MSDLTTALRLLIVGDSASAVRAVNEVGAATAKVDGATKARNDKALAEQEAGGKKARAGMGIMAGGLNIFQFLGWMVAMALYAAGFAGYAQDLLGGGLPSWSGKAIAVGIILAVVVVNFVGSRVVSRAETAIIVLA